MHMYLQTMSRLSEDVGRAAARRVDDAGAGLDSRSNLGLGIVVDLAESRGNIVGLEGRAVSEDR